MQIYFHPPNFLSKKIIDSKLIGCDLLEKSYFCSIANNITAVLSDDDLVVICLKNRTFAVSQTTQSGNDVDLGTLWFAWKIVLLQYRKQRTCSKYSKSRRCDLLEKSYFCSIANNIYLIALRETLLWFAWKIVLLQYRKQLVGRIFNITSCCDLLEKSYFCSIANNWCGLREGRRQVVICLKNRTFAVSQTTRCPYYLNRI